MQSITLCKNTNSHHVSHLYEHIYFIHLDTKLRELGYFSPLDYTIEATTTSGQVKITVEDYTDGLINLQQISDFDIDFSIEITNIAIGQLESEYKQELIIDQPDLLLAELQKIDNAGWENSPKRLKDKIEINDEALKTGEDISISELLITLTYPDVEKDLLPLYRQVAGQTLNTVISDIADTFSGFVSSEAYQTNDKHQLEGVVRFASSIKINADKIIKETVAEIKSAGGYDRLLAILSDIEAAYSAPSPENTFRDLGIKMTAKKWKEIATQENLATVIGNLTYITKIS